MGQWRHCEVGVLGSPFPAVFEVREGAAMSAIWKASIAPKPGRVFLAVPKGASILTVREQGPNLTVWFLCDPTFGVEQRAIDIFMTGDIGTHTDLGRHLGTACFYDGAFVLHAFEPSTK
jgi:hypothetical protein